MSSQTALTDNPPLILDSTCSSKTKARWPKWASIRIDIRREVRPDIVASACYLPFRRELFAKIYCDAPHFILPKGFYSERKISDWFGSHAKHNSRENFVNNLRRFGYWKSKNEWFDFLSKVNVEYLLVLEFDGELCFKLCEGKPRDKRFVKLSDLGLLTNWKIMERKMTWSHHKNPTYFLTMKAKANTHNIASSTNAPLSKL